MAVPERPASPSRRKGRLYMLAGFAAPAVVLALYWLVSAVTGRVRVAVTRQEASLAVFLYAFQIVIAGVVSIPVIGVSWLAPTSRDSEYRLRAQMAFGVISLIVSLVMLVIAVRVVGTAR